MQETGLEVCPVRGYRVGRRWCCSHNQFVQAVLQQMASSARRIASEGSVVERMDGAKSVPWQVVEGIWNGTVYERNVGAFYRQNGMGQNSSGRCREEKQEGIQSKWQSASLFKEVLQQIKKGSGMSCNVHLMRRASYAGKSCDWEGSKVAHQDKGEISGGHSAK